MTIGNPIPLALAGLFRGGSYQVTMAYPDP